MLYIMHQLCFTAAKTLCSKYIIEVISSFFFFGMIYLKLVFEVLQWVKGMWFEEQGKEMGEGLQKALSLFVCRAGQNNMIQSCEAAMKDRENLLTNIKSFLWVLSAFRYFLGGIFIFVCMCACACLPGSHGDF